MRKFFLPKLVVAKFLDGAFTGEGLLRLGLLALTIIVLRFALEFLTSQRTWRWSYIQQGSSHDLLNSHLSSRYSYSEDAESQALYGRLRQVTDSNAHNPYILAMYSLTDLLTGLLGFLLYSLTLGRVDPLVVLLLTATATIHFFLTRWAALYEHRQKDTRAQVDKKSGYLLSVTADPAYGKDIRLYRCADWLLHKLAALFHRLEELDRKNQNQVFFGKLLCTLVALVRDGAAYGILVYGAVTGAIRLDDLLLLGAVQGLSSFLLKTLDGTVPFHSAALYLEDIRQYGERGRPVPPESSLSTEGLAIPLGIELRDVSFAYPDGPVIFDHFSLSIAPGCRLALVGVNGAGKSTLIKLLCGLYTPTSGQILLGGRDISRIPREELWRLFAPVFQDASLLPLWQNIAPLSPEDIEGIQQCVELSGLGEVLRERGKDLNTPLTRVAYEDGLEFSGGQKRKLYLARMLYKNAPILLLDEPTAALDPMAEDQVYRNYARFTQGRTSIFVSHRLASTQMCDRVILLGGGSVLEDGTHQELMERGGLISRCLQCRAPITAPTRRRGRGRNEAG